MMLAVSLELDDPFDAEVIATLAKRRRDHMATLLRDCRYALSEVFMAGHPGTLEQINRDWQLLGRLQADLIRMDKKRDLWGTVEGGLYTNGRDTEPETGS